LDYVTGICSLAARIEERIKEDIDYSELGKTIGYSYHHIRAFFKQFANVSLSRYILARKIAHAAFEIRHSNKSITEIAMEYGFVNSETFTRAFRRYTGMIPSEFKKAKYSCGRRIICAGVYAPVILDLDNSVSNSIFTLQHLKEVNEMSEMKKTNDSCVLYGVSRPIQGSPFPMCLQGVLNYMGQNISYTEIMAYSGVAFRQRWDSNGWNIAANDIRFIYEQHLTAFERGFVGAGRKVIISEDPKMPKAVTKSDAIALIKSELDCGRPVIALGVVGPPEACIVTGYRNNGETLLGWSFFQDTWGGCSFDESGYFIKDNWWEETEAIMSVGEEIGKLIPDRDVLENALMLMTTEEMPTYDGSDLFYGGQAAYEAWAEALTSEFFPGADEIIAPHIDAEVMLGEDRRHAALYIKQMAVQYPNLSTEFTECARLLTSAADCVPLMRSVRENRDMNHSATRQQLAEYIRKAAQYELQACKVLDEIITQMYLAQGEVRQQLRGKATYEINLSTLVPYVNHSRLYSNASINANGQYMFKGSLKYGMEKGNLVINMEDDLDCLQTLKGFTLPLQIEATVKSGGHCGLYFLMGEIIFGEMGFREHDFITDHRMTYYDRVPLPTDRFVNIVWVIEKTYMEVYVNGVLYHRNNKMPYIKILQQSPAVRKIIAPVRVSAGHCSTLEIKSLTVVKL